MSQAINIAEDQVFERTIKVRRLEEKITEVEDGAKEAELRAEEAEQRCASTEQLLKDCEEQLEAYKEKVIKLEVDLKSFAEQTSTVPGAVS